MNEHAQGTSLSEDSDALPLRQEARPGRWSREDEGSTDVRSRPQLGEEESDVLGMGGPETLPELRPRTSSEEWAAASTTKTGVAPLRRQSIEDEDGEGELPALRGAASPVEDIYMLWHTFGRSLGKPVDRPERLRIDHTLSLSSLEVTTLRKILGWLRQIDGVTSCVGLTPASGLALHIPVEQGRIVLTPALLTHLQGIARDGEPEPLTLARWLCALARHHRALPWELAPRPIDAPAASARRVSVVELLLACRPSGQALPDDRATQFAGQTASLSEHTWIFARGAGADPIEGLIYVDAPERRTLGEVYVAAATCAAWLSGSAQLGVLGASQAAWFAIDDALTFSVAGERSVSLQRAPLRSLGLMLARLNAVEEGP